MKLRQIQYFLMVVETGNFTEAAEELYISQSSVSKQIIALEKELGFRLIDRRRRRIALTRAGEAFQQHARAMNDAYLAMMADLGVYKTTPSLAILSLPFIAQYGITDYLAQFRRVYPHLDVTLEEREPVAIFRALKNHSHDLAFTRDHYLDKAMYDDLIIARDRFLVAVCKKHHLANRAAISLNELAGENFVFPGKSSRLDQLVLDACLRAGFEPRVIYTSLRTESILGQVASNSGVSLIMQNLFEHSRHRNVVGIPLDETISSNVVLIWLKDKKLSGATRTFLDFVKTHVIQ